MSSILGHLLGVARVRQQYRRFTAMARASGQRFAAPWKERRVCIGEDGSSAAFDRHYVYHTGWAARVLARTRPALHVDISSSLYFCATASAFTELQFYDYRPPRLSLPGLQVKHADLLSLPFADGSLRSLSCMHVVEHVGLGRYGDPLDPDGDLKAMAQLRRVLAPGGALLLVVPVGRPRIRFNAHRVYAFDQIIHALPSLTMAEFYLVPDTPADADPIAGATKADADCQNEGCGCFLFTSPIDGQHDV